MFLTYSCKVDPSDLEQLGDEEVPKDSGTVDFKNEDENYVIAKIPFVTTTFKKLKFKTKRVFEEDEKEDSDVSDDEDEESSLKKKDFFNSAIQSLKEGNENSDTALSLFAGVKSFKILFFVQLNHTLLQKISKYLKNPVIYTEIEMTSRDPPWGARKHTGCTPVKNKVDFKFKSNRVEMSEASQLIPLKVDEREMDKSEFVSPAFDKFTWKIQIYTEKLTTTRFGGDNFVLKQMYELDESKDMTFVVAHGAEVKAHWGVLMAQSEPFKAMFSTKMKKIDRGRIELPENSEDGMDLFVKFLYGFDIASEVQITSSLALELLKLSSLYCVKDLEEFIKLFLYQKPVKYFTTDALLEMFCFTRNKERFDGLFKYLTTLLSSLSEAAIQSSEYYKGKMNKDEVLSLLFVFNRK